MARKRKPAGKPPEQDFSKVLGEQNPWFDSGVVPDVWARLVERPMAKHLWKRVLHDKPRRFQLILGPRQVGKTTTMYQTVRHLLANKVAPNRLCWLRLDHPLLMRLSLDEMVRTLIKIAKATQAKPVFLFLDELTYAADWDLWLKTFYDEAWPVRIVATSSSTAAIRNRRLESGVGRWKEQYLAPYLFSEYLELIGKPRRIPVEDTLHATMEKCAKAKIPTEDLPDLRRRFMLTGGFPELLLGNEALQENEASALLQSQRTLRSDAVERAVYKDIPQAFGVDNPTMLERLLYTLGGQIAEVLSPNSICQGLDGMSQPTFERYLSYLEKAFIVFTLPNYSGSEASIQKRGRKLYFVDGAVRNAALQRGIAPLKNQTESGLLTENLVAGHLHSFSQQAQVRLYHWRDKTDEVDLVYDHPAQPLAFEIGVGKQHHRKGLVAFSERFERFRERCYVVSPHVTMHMPQPDTYDIGTIPIDLFLLAVSAQAEKELEAHLHTSSSRK